MSYEGWPQDTAPNLQKKLEPGETVQWQGRPVRSRYILRNWPRGCFGMVFFSFSVFWTVMAFLGTSGALGGEPADGFLFRVLFPLWGVPFMAIGFALTFGPLIVAAAEEPNVEYMITNRRALVRSGRKSIEVHSVKLVKVTQVVKTGGAVGSLRFVTTPNPLEFSCIAKPEEAARAAEEAIARAVREAKNDEAHSGH